jgi:hypothetical protein
VVLALKSQLGFLGLLLLAFVLGLARKVKRESVAAVVIPPELRMHWRTLWVSLVVFAAVCLLSHFDISLRHFSVPLALLILMLAPMPRMLEEMRRLAPRFSYAGPAAAVLAVSCLFSAARTYPWYFPYVNALGMGKPAYALLNDSNVDWNQALPEVRQFAERHNLRELALDNYGTSDAALFIPQSHLWDCQAPVQGDGNQWVVVSANMILDGHNCSWLLQYQHEELAGGSMYAFHLPEEIPPAGAPGGPPRPADRRMFLGMPFDLRAMQLQISRHPETIPGVMREMQARFARPQKP